MQNVTDNMRFHAALHQANTALRYGRQGHLDDRDAATNRMYDTLEACQYPYLTVSRVIREIGPKKARVLGLRPRLIDLALKMDVH